MKLSQKTLFQNRFEDDDDDDEEEEEGEEGAFDVAEYEQRGFSKNGKNGGGGDSSKNLKRVDTFYDSTDEYDEDDEEDEEEDEAYYSSNRKRKRRTSSNPFIDDQATVATDDEDDDYYEAEVDRDFIDPVEAVPEEENEARRLRHQRLLPVEDDEVDVDEFERRILQRYSNQSYLENPIEEDISDVEQQALLPSVRDPKLWIVKCAVGREREAAVCLMQKCIDRGRREVQIRSAISPDYLKNYIYVEADKSAHVIEACKGLKVLNTTKVMLVPIKEMTDVVSAKGKPIDVAKDMWVRLKIGIYKGALAKVVNVSDLRRKIMVKLIPRVDLQAIADKLEGRKISKKAFVPSPRLIKTDEARNLNIPVDYKRGRSTNIQFTVIDGKMFKDGFLYKTVSVKSIDYRNIQPTFYELEKFCETGYGVVGSMSTSPRNRKKNHFMKGDAVIIVKGDLKNLMGWVEKVEEDYVHIRPKAKDLHTTIVLNENYVCKSFKPGDHVKVVFGAHKGATGMVIKVNSNVLIILSDATKEDIRVFADHAVDSSEVTTGITRVGDYELHDLVMLDDTSFGVIIRLESETLQVLKGDPDRPDVARVKLREIKYKIERRSTAQDHSSNTVSVKDVVKILMGPCKGKQGPVAHIFRGTLFINDRHHMEHSGFICVKAQSCIVMGGSPSQVSLSSRCGSSTSAPRIPPSPRRSPSGGPPFDSGGRQTGGQRGHDSFVGSTIKIRVGHYKGCRGRVVSVKGQSVRVELESQMKTVLVNRNEISNHLDASTSFGEPPQHGIGSETPTHHLQTPTRSSYMTPTRNEGETPGNSGIWTPLRDQATPAGAKWEDGNPGSWGTIPQAQTPRSRSNEAPSTASGWGNWGDGHRGSSATSPERHQGTPLAQSSEAPALAQNTGSGWGSWGDGNGSQKTSQYHSGVLLGGSNEAPVPAPSAGASWGSWGDGNRGSQRGTPFARSNEAPAVAPKWGNHSQETSPQCQQGTSACSNEKPAPSTGAGWGSWGNENRGSQGTNPRSQQGTALARPNEALAPSWGNGNRGSHETSSQYHSGTPLARSNEASSTGPGWGSWGNGNRSSQSQRGTSLSRPNEAPAPAPSTGSGWGNWGNGNRSSQGISPQSQQGTSLSRPNEAPAPSPSTSSGWGSWGNGNRSSQGISPQSQWGTSLSRPNEAPAPAPSTGSGWGSWGNGNRSSQGKCQITSQQGTSLSRSNEAPAPAPSTGSGWGSWGDGNRGSQGTSSQCQRETPRAHSNESPTLTTNTGWGMWGDGNRGSQGASPQCQWGTPLAGSNETPTPALALSRGSGWGSLGDGNRGASRGTSPRCERETPVAQAQASKSTVTTGWA